LKRKFRYPTPRFAFAPTAGRVRTARHAKPLFVLLNEGCGFLSLRESTEKSFSVWRAVPDIFSDA
jgi:hypothetical protein